jgi:hypothetical protein
MRSQLRLTMLLLAALPNLAQAQYWELFPLDQRSYFQRTEWGSVELLDMFLMDSIRVTGSEQVLLFDARQTVGGAEDCTAQVLEAIPWWGWGVSPDRIDSLLLRNDTVFYHTFGSSLPFFFLPQAQPGQSWTVTSDASGNAWQQITITCAGVAEESIWGVLDSVKTFTMSSNGVNPGQTPISAFTIRLSRTFGLLEFVPFRLFLIHPPSVSFSSTTCIGLGRAGLELGFRPPDFSDFFQLQAGDIRLWRDTQVNVFPFPPVIRYWRDSIVGSNITPDTVRYTYLRWRQDPDMSIHGPWLRTDTMTRSGTGPIVESPPNWLAIGHDGYLPTDMGLLVWKNTRMQLLYGGVTDTIVSVTFQSDATSVDVIDCMVYQPTDSGYGMRFNTHAGLEEHCMYAISPAQWCWELIGWQIGSDQQGPIALSTNHLQPVNTPPYAVYPNPATDLLFIRDLPPGLAVRYALLDAWGAQVSNGTINDGSIPVHNLASGVYQLRLFIGERLAHVRFVKA